MFSSSLRKRSTWRYQVTNLLRSKAPMWRETPLTECDIAFPVQGCPSLPNSTFRMCLLDSGDIDSGEALQKIERLRYMDGGRHVAVILLVDGLDATDKYFKLEMQQIRSICVPIFPIPSAPDLLQCINHIQQQYHTPPASTAYVQPSRGSLKSVIAHCVEGRPLSRHTVNVLTDITGGVPDLVSQLSSEQGDALLRGFLEKEDIERLRLFFLGGPQPCEA